MTAGLAALDACGFLRELVGVGRGRVEIALAVASVDSTNASARRLLAAHRREAEGGDLPELLLVAHSQSEGRGRAGHVWWSPPGQGVYATLVVTLPSGVLPLLPLAAGLALAGALDRLLPTRPALKWPNDVLVDGRKIAGILIETTSIRAGRAAALVGFGINWAEGPEASPFAAATSLARERGEASLSELLAVSVDALHVEIRGLEDPATLVSRYVQRTTHRLGQVLRCHCGERLIEGRFLGIDEVGRLRLETGEGEMQLSSGEIQEVR